MKKIVFINDFLSHDCSNEDTYHKWLCDLVSPLIKMATGQDVIGIEDLVADQIKFSREDFFAKSLLKNIPLSYYIYDASLIKQESIDYLAHFFNKDVIVIGIEISLDLRKILDKLGVVFINFWFHSYKLFDDVAFMINTNNSCVYRKLKKYQIPQEQFYFYANYWKIQIKESRRFNDLILEDNSVLFVGQTFKDKSIQKDGKFLSILDYKEQMSKIAKNYKKIYYTPHPSAINNTDIDAYIDSVDYIEKIQFTPTYFFLTSSKIKKIISISSSVIYEAQFFKKDVEYLYQSLFDIDGLFNINSFISVYNSYFNPFFWSDVLSEVFDTNKEVINKILFMEDKNKIRNIRGLYFGYVVLDDCMCLKTLIENKAGQAEIKAEQAEVKAEQAETIAQQAEAKTEQAETIAQQAEAKAEQAETIAQQAEIKAEQAEVKAEQAETIAQQAEARAEQAETKAQQAEIKAQQSDIKAKQAEAIAQQAEAKAEQAEVSAQQAEVKAGQTETALNAIYFSRSWRITAPLRWIGQQARLMRQRCKPENLLGKNKKQ